MKDGSYLCRWSIKAGCYFVGRSLGSYSFRQVATNAGSFWAGYLIGKSLI